MAPLRKCKRCGKEALSKQDLEVFVPHNASKYGRMNQCKECYHKHTSELRLRRKKERNEKGLCLECNGPRDRDGLLVCKTCDAKKHTETQLKKDYEIRRKRHKIRRREVFTKLSKRDSNINKPTCVRCGCDDYKILEINHKNGGGRREYAQYRGYNFIRMIHQGKLDQAQYEVTCKICNAAHYAERITNHKWSIVFHQYR